MQKRIKKIVRNINGKHYLTMDRSKNNLPEPNVRVDLIGIQVIDIFDETLG